MRPNLKVIASLLFIALVCAWAFFVTACSKQEARFATGKVIPASVLPGWHGDDVYAEVNPAALPEIYKTFRGVLTLLGLVKWDRRFDCNKFASLYIAVAHVRFAVVAWHSNTPAQSLALAEVWYRRPDGTAHAIVQARTPAGDIFIEPQTGEQVAAVQPYFRKW